MGQRNHKIVLFLCTGNYYRSRFAEVLFNSVAGKMALPWRATSRGLAIERGVNNVGPMAVAAIEELERMGVRDADAVARLPAQVTADELGRADRVVAMKQTEHLPLFRERFPTWAEKVEYWEVDDAPGVLGLIEQEVMGLIARLIGGGQPREPAAQPVSTRVERGLNGLVGPLTEGMPGPETATKGAGKGAAEKPAVVRLSRETKGRRGKGVTVVSDVPLDEAGLLDLGARLKQRCGTGGTVRDGRIEIQGDQRDRLTAVLQEMGYRVKRAGG